MTEEMMMVAFTTFTMMFLGEGKNQDNFSVIAMQHSSISVQLHFNFFGSTCKVSERNLGLSHGVITTSIMIEDRNVKVLGFVKNSNIEFLIPDRVQLLLDNFTLDSQMSLLEHHIRIAGIFGEEVMILGEKIQLHIHLKSAHDLLAKDHHFLSKNTSDPYVVIKQGHLAVKSEIVKKELNPVWNQKFDMGILDKGEDLELEVFDHDTGGDDGMGKAKVPLGNLTSTPEEIEVQLKGDAGMLHRNHGKIILILSMTDESSHSPGEHHHHHLLIHLLVKLHKQVSHLCGLMECLHLMIDHLFNNNNNNNNNSNHLMLINKMVGLLHLHPIMVICHL